MRLLPQSCGASFIGRLTATITFTLVALLPAAVMAATPQLVCSPSSLRFGGVPLKQSETQVVVLTNAGQTSVSISAIGVSGSEFAVSGLNLPVELSAGQSVGLNVVFTPPTTGLTSGTITFASTASNSTLQLVVAGMGFQSDSVLASPSSISFGNVPVGSSTTRSIVLTNERPWARSITSVTIVGKAFSVGGLTLPLELSPHQSVTLDVTFSPQSAKETSGSAFLYGPGLNIPLSGTGTVTTVGQLSISPASVNFGSIDVGSSSAQTITLTATGGSVTLSSDASTKSQFSVSGLTLPFTLKTGQSTQAQLVFTPSATGSLSGSFTVNSDASDATVTAALAGVGVAPQYSVTLSWNPSTSSVTGYNVYRGTSVGAYSKLNGSLNSTTSYTDNTVVSGSTYYYAATAVSSNGQESSYSAPLKVAIP
jgi:Abnormal spindle-like microcephaly-assoc'd, ASPM-SPD-2-Hydin